MLSRIKTKVRSLVGDTEKTTNEPFEYTGSNVFTLTESNVTEVTKVTIDGNELGSGESFTFDSETNTVTVTATLTSGQVITIYYKYQCFSDTELEAFITSSLIQLSVNKYLREGEPYRMEESSGEVNTIYPTPDEKDENLIAFVASILIKPNYSQYRLPTLSISYPVKLCKDEKITRAINRFKSNIGISGAIEL